MKPNNFVTLKQVYKAAYYWYDDLSRENLCLAENRLMKGEIPHKDFYETK